ncbi:MAG: phage major tail protein, TP901-1 family [Rhizobiales bacterium]|nr:phage major tail protein, TP901-1 family [Hyphomicrobiales bacterium]
MTAQKGKDLLLKLYSNTTSQFETVAGLRSKQIAFNSQSVDITHSESAGRWREMLAQAGTREASFSGSGVFKDAASDAAVKDVFFSGEIPGWQVVIPDFGVVEGPFQITSLEYSGQHDGEVTFDVTIRSAGELSFTGI